MRIIGCSKELNQYYGKDFEKLVYKKLSNKEVPLSNKVLCLDIGKMKEDALLMADFIKSKIDIKNVTYTGNNVNKRNGDLNIDGKDIELKYVGNSGSGTYFNTSMIFLEQIGLKSFREFDKPIRDYLFNFFGKQVYDNTSPVTMAQSKEFRYKNIKEYEELKKIDKAWRKKYVDYIYNELVSNKQLFNKFVKSLLNKSITNECCPDFIFYMNHEDQNIGFFDIRSIKDISLQLSKTELGLNLGKLRIAISWQNGTGLNNPTVRVFIN